MTAETESVTGPLSLSDVAMIRAYARQIKASKFDSIQDVRESLYDELSQELSEPMLKMLELLCDPDAVIQLCDTTFNEMHTRGIRS